MTKESFILLFVIALIIVGIPFIHKIDRASEEDWISDCKAAGGTVITYKDGSSPACEGKQ